MKYFLAVLIVISVDWLLELVDKKINIINKLFNINFRNRKKFMLISLSIMIIFGLLMEIFISLANEKFDNQNFLSLIIRVVEIYIIGKVLLVIFNKGRSI